MLSIILSDHELSVHSGPLKEEDSIDDDTSSLSLAPSDKNKRNLYNLPVIQEKPPPPNEPRLPLNMMTARADALSEIQEHEAETGTVKGDDPESAKHQIWHELYGHKAVASKFRNMEDRPSMKVRKEVAA